MAIDSKPKRFSMLQFSEPDIVAVLPDPDGTMAAGDRAHLLGLYSGIALGAPAVLGDAEAGAVVVVAGGDTVELVGGDSIIPVGGDVLESPA